MLDLILCVDDDPITLMLCKKVIRKSSFANEIITANNGEEAIQFFDKIKQNISKNETPNLPQLILLDLNMPIMGGWEFLDCFSTETYAEFNSVKVVILSSTIDPEDLNNAKKYPVVIDFLPKPVTTSMLEYLANKIK